MAIVRVFKRPGRHQLFEARRLRHRIDEAVGDQMHFIDLARLEIVQHEHDGADEIIQPGFVADMGGLAHDCSAHRAEEPGPFSADHA